MGTYLFSNYSKKPFEIMSAKGSYVVDSLGEKYLDLTSGIGVCNLGYRNPKLENALIEQSDLIWHMPNLYVSSLQEEVAQKLSYKQKYLAFFCNSGTEANEAAIKLVRKYTGKTEIITFNNSFHGRTYASMTATGQSSIHDGFGPLLEGFTYMTYNDPKSIEAITSDTAAVMLELVQGEGGVILADYKWIQNLSKVCKDNGVLLVIDEVQTGIGRTGSTFVFEQYDIEPDIYTVAKGLANGIPAGAMLGKKELGSAFTPGTHGSTFGGNKLAMAVASQVLDIFENTSILDQVKEKSNFIFEEVKNLDSAKISQIRGLGLMIGIELKKEFPVEKILSDLEGKGILALRAGQNTLRLLPPLTIIQKELEEGLSSLKEVLE
ncbi:acetylornithine transaminase [Floricoccus penangensis]|uniref:Acetylornithine transaminase n=1 Tax=Floricoccus penangensis TaxID=1859475 RepID=A0A9Q5JHA5_9LACT|nr:acetylornithine transaminase [Floricoccus penangensis]OFI47174.1 acetylornithine transaminase [Floricoccus penangensis]